MAKTDSSVLNNTGIFKEQASHNRNPMEKASLPNASFKSAWSAWKILNELPNVQEASSLPLLFSEMFPKENNLYTAQGI